MLRESRDARSSLQRSGDRVGAMAGHEKNFEQKPRVEEHLVYALLALPIFAVTIFIVVLLATLGNKNP